MVIRIGDGWPPVCVELALLLLFLPPLIEYQLFFLIVAFYAVLNALPQHSCYENILCACFCDLAGKLIVEKVTVKNRH